MSKNSHRKNPGVNASGETQIKLNGMKHICVSFEFLGWGQLRQTEFINVLRFIDILFYTIVT